MKGPPEMCEPHVNASSSTSSGGNNSYQNKSIDFADYMWMGDADLEDFDKKCEDEFWEEFLMEQAYEQMIAEEEERETSVYAGGPGSRPEVPVGDGNPSNPGGSVRYVEVHQPPQPQRISDLEMHMAELNVNSNNAHFQGRYNPRPRMCNPQFRWQNQERRQNRPQMPPHRHQQQQHQRQMPPSDNYLQMQPQAPTPASQPLSHPQQQQQHVIVSAAAVGIDHHGLSAAMIPRLNPDAPAFVPRGAFAQPVSIAAQHSFER